MNKKATFGNIRKERGLCLVVNAVLEIHIYTFILALLLLSLCVFSVKTCVENSIIQNQHKANVESTLTSDVILNEDKANVKSVYVTLPPYLAKHKDNVTDFHSTYVYSNDTIAFFNTLQYQYDSENLIAIVGLLGTSVLELVFLGSSLVFFFVSKARRDDLYLYLKPFMVFGLLLLTPLFIALLVAVSNSPNITDFFSIAKYKQLQYSCPYNEDKDLSPCNAHAARCYSNGDFMNIDGASNTHCYCPHENQCYNVTYIKWYCNTLNNTNVDKGCQLFNITHIFETGQTALLPYIFRRQFLCHEVNNIDAGKIDTIPYCS